MAPQRLEEFVATLSSLCQKVAGGDYEEADSLFAMTSDSAGLPPDLVELAEAFGMMVVRVQAREFSLNELIDELRHTQAELEQARARLAEENKTLKREVSELRIEVDTQKRDRQVAEITDTDYFQSLRERARAMRERKG